LTDIILSQPRLTLGPVLFNWKPEHLRDFYFRIADEADVDTVCVGEVVCSKRSPFFAPHLPEVIDRLSKAGKEVVLSSLALVEAESELNATMRMLEHGRFLVEANDLTAVQLCREHGRPFVAGPSLNIYNHRALALLMEDGLRRWVPGVEQGMSLLDDLLMGHLCEGGQLPELEVIGWGRLPLSWSARCFTARALDVPKDACGFRCIEFPDGLPLRTREGEGFLRINGIQIQGEEIIDMGPELPLLRALQVGILRLYPQAEGMRDVVEHFDLARGSATPPPRIGAINGYWHGMPGKPGLPAS